MQVVEGLILLISLSHGGSSHQATCPRHPRASSNCPEAAGGWGEAAKSRAVFNSVCLGELKNTFGWCILLCANARRQWVREFIPGPELNLEKGTKEGGRGRKHEHNAQKDDAFFADKFRKEIKNITHTHTLRAMHWMCMKALSQSIQGNRMAMWNYKKS